MNLGKESETLEFKRTTAEIKEAMISIASILNKHGVGTLYFGVKSTGDIVGQDVSEASLRDVSRVVYESIKPQIYPVIEEVVIDDCHLIKVEFSGENAPYSAGGRYYLRTADEDREVTPKELKTFFGANKYRGRWEKEKSEATSKQIDRITIRKFWQKAITSGRLPNGKYTCPLILHRFGLVKNDYLTNAGEALFGSTLPITLKVGIFATDEKRYSYESMDNGFKFIIYRPQIISDISDVTYNVTYKDSLNTTEELVLAVLKQNPEISRDEMADRVSKTVRTVQRALVSLTEKGYIKRVGAKKNSTWKVLI